MSSDKLFKLARLAGVASLIAAAGLLSSCQVRPLYAESTGVTQKLADVSFSDANSRVGQQVRNQLIFIAGRGAGETKNPKYTVDLSVSSGTGGVLYLPSSDTSGAGRTTVTASFTLKNVSDGKVLKSGSRSVTSLVDFPTQEFAKARAIRDSEDRAAREVAELVGADIAAALSR
ncbi:LPS assembly lipoprotein LptE [Rhizobium sp. BK602]|uniref:LPS assembly lipoprotein LptE n=1 Tax=Rhizobium sp. BK602 TaxID=2586986 RepID=UPI0016222FE9|nr:LPS assembly lipoprotein LptE [Rhizobium sp. BK602]MBB3611532.1 LPS-assembly lipoprotein [Rhizobium sp. BK602]